MWEVALIDIWTGITMSVLPNWFRGKCLIYIHLYTSKSKYDILITTQPILGELKKVINKKIKFQNRRCIQLLANNTIKLKIWKFGEIISIELKTIGSWEFSEDLVKLSFSLYCTIKSPNLRKYSLICWHHCSILFWPQHFFMESNLYYKRFG